MRLIQKYSALILGTGLLIASCKKGTDDPYDPSLNPINGSNEEVVNPINPAELDNFVGLHAKIFSPTCGNSGCHDGTTVNNPAFPPIDFSSLEAAYSTLLKQSVRNNNEQSTFNFIVDPGNPDGSALLGRMLDNELNPAGVMPLEADDDAYWETNKDVFINSIRNWIAAGAPDMFGNPYSEGNEKPNYTGLFAERVDGTKLTRAGAQEQLQIPFADTSVQFFVALTDKETDPANFTTNQIQVSTNATDFSNAITFNLEAITPFVDQGRYTDTARYTHSFTISRPDTLFPVNSIRYMRYIIRDENNFDTEIPSDNSTLDVIKYFSFSRFNG